MPQSYPLLGFEIVARYRTLNLNRRVRLTGQQREVDHFLRGSNLAAYDIYIICGELNEATFRISADDWVRGPDARRELIDDFRTLYRPWVGKLYREDLREIFIGLLREDPRFELVDRGY